MAPQAGLEPATKRLTAICSTTELPRNHIFFNRLEFIINNKCIYLGNIYETNENNRNMQFSPLISSFSLFSS